MNFGSKRILEKAKYKINRKVFAFKKTFWKSIANYYLEWWSCYEQYI